ncbi:uncharacterized protein LOC121797174 isoform X2 [Salvia splendens]|nr:uncharacterized protein LOC121797174 isoform X2 [Salvia splendens]
MEQPHNAVLLLCSSHEKGCRPFICDTSYRHSNCFDQFRKLSSGKANLHALSEELQSDLVCPLCRGKVTGWDVVYLARKFLNSKTRNCSLETCSFSGNYAELRKHARLEHPCGRPSEASPNRQANWTTLQQQGDFIDAHAYQSDIEYDSNTWPGWDTLFPLDELLEDELWSTGSLFDLPSGISDVEDDLSTINGLAIPYFSPYVVYPGDDMVDSDSSRNGDLDIIDYGSSRSGGDGPQWATVSGPSLNLHLGNAAPSSGSGPTNHSGDDANVSSSRPSYQMQEGQSNSRSRSSHSRADDPASSRASNSNASRSGVRYHREIDHGSSRRRSSYGRESEQRYSRSREVPPRVRRSGTRSFPDA